MTENEAREHVRDYLNETDKIEELMNHFEIKKCECGTYELEEDMEYRNYDLGGHDGKVCRGCSHE
jgi:hypothetical protein